MLPQILFTVLVFVWHCLKAEANTESIVLDFNSEQFVVANASLLPCFDVNSAGSVAINEPNILKLVSGFQTNSEYELQNSKQFFNYNYYVINIEDTVDNPNCFFYIRVCWPALYPVSIDLSYVNLVVNGEATKLIELKSHSKFYSSNSSLMNSDMVVPINLFITPTFAYKWGNNGKTFNLPIPTDLLQTLKLTGLIALCCLLTTKPLLSFLSS